MRFRPLLLVFLIFFLKSTAQGADPQVFGKVPLRFEVNHGQADSRVKFLARGPGDGLFVTENETILRLARSSPAVVRMSLQGQSSASRLEGLDLLPGKTHYLKGSNAAGWYGDLPAYERVRHSGVYPGVDLIYYGNQQQLEYDVVV